MYMLLLSLIAILARLVASFSTTSFSFLEPQNPCFVCGILYGGFQKRPFLDFLDNGLEKKEWKKASAFYRTWGVYVYWFLDAEIWSRFDFELKIWRIWVVFLWGKIGSMNWKNRVWGIHDMDGFVDGEMNWVCVESMNCDLRPGSSLNGSTNLATVQWCEWILLEICCLFF